LPGELRPHIIRTGVERVDAGACQQQLKHEDRSAAQEA
jgi:hypothetical protein